MVLFKKRSYLIDKIGFGKTQVKIMEERNRMSLQALCEKEGTYELGKKYVTGNDGKSRLLYSLGKRIIWASDNAHKLIEEGEIALEEGDIVKAKNCFNNIMYTEYKKEGLPDFDEKGRPNWVPSLIVCKSQQITPSSKNLLVKRNEMSYSAFCEKEGSTKIDCFDFIAKDGRKHIFFRLGSKKIIWASEKARQAILNQQYKHIVYVEVKEKELPDYDSQGRSNWIPSLLIDDRIKTTLPFSNSEKDDSNRLLYEEGTLYANKIQKLRSPSFSNIRNISVWFLKDYCDEEKNNLKNRISDGTSILTTYEQLHAYMFSFGLMHEAKLKRAFSKIPQSLFTPEIEVIDYACGQGIATICLSNFIEENINATVIRKITLIEPSAIALSRASLICHKVCPKALKDTINLGFDNLESTLISKSKIKRFHLLSNILDMTCYDINHLAKVISETANIGDIFVCVDPWYHNDDKDGRQRKLMRLLNGKEIYHDAFNSGELVPDRTWTAYITIFII